MIRELYIPIYWTITTSRAARGSTPIGIGKALGGLQHFHSPRMEVVQTLRLIYHQRVTKVRLFQGRTIAP